MVAVGRRISDEKAPAVAIPPGPSFRPRHRRSARRRSWRRGSGWDEGVHLRHLDLQERVWPSLGGPSSIVRKGTVGLLLIGLLCSAAGCDGLGPQPWAA